MKCTELLLCVYGLINVADAWLQWSKSYTLKAVLTVPAANLSEPYQVWLDADTKKSRVDFYNGMVKLYRAWNDLEQKYEYFKIHPETTDKFTNKNMCHELPGDTTETRMYATNTYLPVKDFKFIKNENIDSATETQKWEYSILVDQILNTSVTYTVWVTFMDKTPVPVRFVYEVKAGGSMTDYFRHDYSSYDDAKPSRDDVQMLFGLDCEPLEDESGHEPIDPLMEYVEPSLEHSRVSGVFDRFKKIHNKKYKSEGEHFRRLNIFKNNLRYINSVNRQRRPFSLAVNHLADLSDREIFLLMGIKHTESDIMKVKLSILDDDSDDDDEELESDPNHSSFDWRNYGAVTSVKDQTMLCGSCYAFTTAAAIESAAFIARGCHNLEEVSEQALIDCTWGDEEDGNYGCSGGTYEFTLAWVQKHGVPFKQEYGSYLALEGKCHIMNMTRLVTIQSSVHVERKTPIIKETLRQKGPLLVAIDGALKSFTFYSSGVYDDPKCSSEPRMRSHGVTLIGYGHEADQKYWILKNSFGAQWGEQGYMRLATNRNKCGLQNFVYSVGFNKSKVANCVKKYI